MSRIEHSIDINVPVRTVYDQLTRFEQYPRFMEGVEEVRRLDDSHLHWHTKAGDRDIEWDAEITEQVPDRCIAWRNTSGPRNRGRLRLQPIDEIGTRLVLTMDCEPQQQASGQADAERMLAQRTEQDLARFKKFIEGARRESGARVSDDEWQQSAEAATPAREGAMPPRADRRAGGDRRERAPSPLPRQPLLPGLLQAWGEPFGVMRRVSEEMEQIAQRFIGRPAFGVHARHGNPLGWTPTVELSQHDDRLVVCAELPGVRREDVQIEIRSDRLTIEGDRHPQAPHGQREFQRTERAYGHFYRAITLPEGADKDAASAAMHDGVLEITIPVSQAARRARRIDIQG